MDIDTTPLPIIRAKIVASMPEIIANILVNPGICTFNHT
ncbi:hypothetical protein CCAND93_670007 [Capnocytophaga canis]|uniref:Uncharacterized protein n=1 Tax=Capnocytophaga canis TaxID=1848903 RepID=A0A0B7ITK9_9FLAO|nr:hypothetical protein CCAND93_670007 [Capnocytophaga canis]